MKFRWYKHLSVALIIALLVSAMPVYAEEPTETKSATVIHFVKDGEATTLSAAHEFFSNPYIVVNNGTQFLEVEMTKSFALEFIINNDPGTIVSENADTIVKRYELKDVTDQFTATTKYKITTGGSLSSHEVTVVIGNDIDNTKAELIAAIAEADALTDRSVSFDTTIASAQAANTYLTKLAIMEAALLALQAAIAEHNQEEVTPTPEPVDPTLVMLSYVQAENKNVDFGSSMSPFILKTNVETRDRKTYLKVMYKKVANLVLTVNNSTGTLIDDSHPEDKLYEFLIASKTAPIPASISYSYGPISHTFNMFIIIDQDATDADRTALKDKIDEAKAVTEKGAILVQAIAAANENLNLVSRKATLAAHVTALQAALETNTAIEETLKGVAVIYHEASDKNTVNDEIGNIFMNPSVYTQNNRTFLRVDTDDLTEFAVTSNGKAATEVGENQLDLEISAVDAAQHIVVNYESNDTTVTLDVYVTIEPNATDEDRSTLTAKINEGNTIEGKDISLQTALDLAIADNNKTSHKQRLAAHVVNITAAIAANNAIVNTLKSATLNYVKSTDLNNSFDDSFASFFSEPQTYTIDGNNYIRVKVQNKLSLKLTVNQWNGKVVGFVYNADELTHFIMDYQVDANLNTPVISQVSYVSGSYVGRHDQYLVINQDATAEDRKALTAAINAAEAVIKKGTALISALNNAKAVDNLLTRKAVLNAQVKVLTDAIAANSTTAPPANVQIHEGSGLEVGKYEIGVKVLKDNSDDASYMDGSIDGMARLSVTKNKLTVYVILHDASMIQSLTVSGKNASIANKYAEDNVARYSFEVSTLTAPTNARIHVIATLPDGSILYDTKHDIRFSFDAAFKVDQWEDEGYVNKVANGETGTEQPEDTDTKTKTEAGTDGGETSGNNGNNNGSTNASPKFTDIDNSWAKAAIERAVSLKLVNGYSDGSFKPNQEINRAEFTAILVRAMKLEAAKGEVKFTDANKIQGWAKEYIQQAVEAGILTGYNDNTFRPSGDITRTEAAVMVVKALGLELVSEEELTFTDAAKIPAYARAYVATAVKHGLVTGYSNNTFGPTKVATRADAIALALRALDYRVSYK